MTRLFRISSVKKGQASEEAQREDFPRFSLVSGDMSRSFLFIGRSLSSRSAPDRGLSAADSDARTAAFRRTVPLRAFMEGMT